MSEKKSWTIPGAHFGGDPEFFTAWTLFDIGLDSSKSRDNLHILIDLVSMRGQPILSGVDMVTDQDITDGFFGKNHSGRQTVWSYKWIVDKVGLMSEQTLISESNGLPMQTGLNETAKLEPKIITSGADANTFFIRHESL